jgi:hypothetical protein
MRNIFGIVLFVISVPLFASTPTCHEYPGGNYCVYSGVVQSIYVNASNTILLYFDNAVDVSIPQSFGINVTRGNAAAIAIGDNPEFAKFFYSTALAAQASGRKVTIQMRGVTSGYLKADRIWLAAP